MQRKIIFSFFIITALSLLFTVSISNANSNPIIKIHFTHQNSNVNINQKYNISLLYENQYHNLSQVYQELENFNSSAPELIDYSSIGLSYYNNSIPLIILTNENIPSHTKGKTYIVAHHHAREQITIEHTLRTIRDLVNDYGSDSEITHLLNRTIIYFIVTLNPDNLNNVLNQNEYLRKTARPIDDDGDGLFDEDGPDDTNGDGRISQYAVTRGAIDNWTYTFTYEGFDNDGDGKVNEDWIGGVDINRNYPFHWNESTADSGATSDKTSLTYPGDKPASERETQALMEFVSEYNFTHALSLHSGTNATLFDWGYTNQIMQPEASMYAEIDYEMQQWGILPDSFFTKDNDVDYTVAGSWDDWTYAERHTIPLTLEIYHKANSEYYFFQEFNGTHYIYEFNTMFEYFNPAAEKIDDLHSDLIKFEKFWLSLTPGIELDSYENIILNNNDKLVRLDFRSISKFFNTTDIPKVYISPSHDGVIKNYTSILQPLERYTPTTLEVILSSKIPADFYFDLNITSEWASDFFIRIEIDRSDFKSADGFSLVLTIATLITFLFIHKRKS
ncbi:MAG: M14 family zinc carboxypeptidase [Candidatus Hodarchaeales archaeon]